MDFFPTFIPEALPDHLLQASPLLTPCLTMEDGDGFLPQASPLVPPYLDVFINMEEGSTEQCDNLSFHMNETNPVIAEPIISSHASMSPCLNQHTIHIPSSASCFTHDPTLLLSQPHPFELEQGQHLLNLQALLKSQYGVTLTFDQLLAFDALPALLQAEGDQSQLDEALALNDVRPQKHLDNVGTKLDDALNDIELQNFEVLPHLTSKIFCLNEQHGSQEASSTGSATSSSMLTDGENTDNPSSVECLTATASFLSSLGAVSTQSWVTPTLSWMPSYEEISLIQALNALQPSEVTEPPLQRRKLHGITIEQVLQAEQMQQQQQQQKIQPAARLNWSENAFNSLHLSTNLVESPSPVLIGPPTEMFIGVNNTNHELMRPHLHPGKPAATSVEPQSIAARHRRKRIRDRTESLGLIIPGATRLDTAAMFDLAIKYVNFLQAQMLCLENEVSLSNQRLDTEDDAVASFRRALLHRLISSQDVQHLLSREGLCLVTEGLVQNLKF